MPWARWPSAIALAIRAPPARRATAAPRPGAIEAIVAPIRSSGGATETSARSRVMASSTPRATARGVTVRMPGLGAGSGEHARVADEPGQHDGHAHSGAVQVLAQAVGESAQAELGRVVQG